MLTRLFVENIYEIAYGEDAINKDYSDNDVKKKIQEFSDKAMKPSISDLLLYIENKYITIQPDEITEDDVFFYERLSEEINEFNNASK